MIEELVANGADPFRKNQTGMHALHLAAQGNQPAAMCYLIDKLGFELDSGDNMHSAAVHWAAFSGNVLAMSYILAWGANPNCKDEKGSTPLHLAVLNSQQSRSTRLIRDLLIKGADCFEVDRKNRTPLEYARDKLANDTTWFHEIEKVLVEAAGSHKPFSKRLSEFLMIT